MLFPPVKTVWAMVGLFDWDTLTVKDNKNYEAGVFKLINNRPVPTLLAEAVNAIISVGDVTDISIVKKGWWECEERIAYSLDNYIH